MHRGLRIAMLGLIPAPLAAASALAPIPLLLVNTSPSEPPGLYLRTRSPAAVGLIIAFRAPAQAYPYVGLAMPERARSSFLKTVRAGEGDLVCANRQRLVVNGRDLAGVAPVDRQGRPLPQWRDCRRLRSGEWFVLSTRIPNSFDSRYYGPVRRSEILGVYAPILTLGGLS